ncbi:hypothetical protein BU15DRAFT_62421 [Melanogaster broomeanus]|nr:hypothetical protein BU15DRAFT_62421 [Melanogaster broomeanus]
MAWVVPNGMPLHSEPPKPSLTYRGEQSAVIPKLEWHEVVTPQALESHRIIKCQWQAIICALRRSLQFHNPEITAIVSMFLEADAAGVIPLVSLRNMSVLSVLFTKLVVQTQRYWSGEPLFGLDWRGPAELQLSLEVSTHNSSHISVSSINFVEATSIGRYVGRRIHQLRECDLNKPGLGWTTMTCIKIYYWTSWTFERSALPCPYEFIRTMHVRTRCTILNKLVFKKSPVHFKIRMTVLTIIVSNNGVRIPGIGSSSPPGWRVPISSLNRVEQSLDQSLKLGIKPSSPGYTLGQSDGQIILSWHKQTGLGASVVITKSEHVNRQNGNLKGQGAAYALDMELAYDAVVVQRGIRWAVHKTVRYLETDLTFEVQAATTLVGKWPCGSAQAA